MNANEIVSQLKYLILTPSVTSMGACPKCGTGSRGASLCHWCLIEDNPPRVQTTLEQIILCLEAQQRNRLLLESLVENLNGDWIYEHRQAGSSKD